MMANIIQIEQHGRLSEIIGRVGQILKTSETGPLVAAETIVDLAKNWESYRAEAEGKDCTTFLRATLGKRYSVAFFSRRHDAIMKLARGDIATARSLRTRISDTAAVWMSQQPTLTPHFDKLAFELRKAFKAQGDNPVGHRQAIRIAHMLTNHQVKANTCHRCEALEAQVRELGGEPKA